MHITGFHWAEAALISPKLVAAHLYTISRKSEPPPAISHGLWVLDYSFSDGADVRAGKYGNQWEARAANQAHLYAPRTKYWERIRNDIRAGYIKFQDGDAARITLLTGKRGYARINDLSGRIGRHISDIAELGYKRGESAFWEAHSLFVRIVGLLLAAEQVGGDLYSVSGEERPPQSLSEKVMAYLRMNYHRRLTLDMIAREMHVSQSTLTHRFYKESGNSPIQALIEIRLSMVRQLVLRGEKLDAIAIKTGFCDAYHLSKMFRKHYGAPPSKYLGRD